MHIKRNKMKITLSLMLLASMLLVIAAPAFAAQKITNPGNFGAIDGISEDPDVGLHNSYAWCSELFAQADGDYLWVGMNRDMGRSMFANAVGDEGASSIANMLGTLTGLPETSADQTGKIYRQKAADDDAKWELVYENPAISGYRRMILFQGNLYVCAGLTNMPEYDYSFILRFKPDFKPGDQPEIVLWDTIPLINSNTNPDGVPIYRPEYFRSACLFEDKLYIGTFDNKIYATDGTGLANLTPGTGAKSTGWTLFADLEEEPSFEPPNGNVFAGLPFIWDMIGFNGSLYAFCTNGGFTVYKLTPNAAAANGYDITQTIGGNASAKYPYGMGIETNYMASPFHSVSFGKDYVYVSTFANGPFLLGNWAMGKSEIAFEQLFNPAQIYRFDADDNWEAIVGDTTGKYVAKDKTGTPLPVIGNQRAGFFPGADSELNTSYTQYIWWMTEYNGKLYASTWDLVVFKDKGPLLIALSLLSSITGGGAGGLLAGGGGTVISALQTVVGLFRRVMAGITGGQAAGAAAYAAGSQAVLGATYSPGLDLNLNLGDIAKAVGNFVWEVVKQLAYKAFLKIVERINPESSLFTILDYNDKTNPAGFDLFVSEDGVNFSPVTVDGFGNGQNYGGRVLLPTKYGLFCSIANPFGGGQVWRVDDMKQEIQPNIPATVTLKVGQTFKASLRSLALPSGSTVLLDGTSDYAQISLVKRGPEGTIIDVESAVTLTDGAYSETHRNKEYPAQMYDIVFAGQTAGTQDVTLRFYWNSLEVQKTVTVVVTS